MVICGATGDLTERKLAPALYNSFLGGFLPPEFTVVGFARREMSDDDFRAHLLAGIDEHSRNKPAKPAILPQPAGTKNQASTTRPISARTSCSGEAGSVPEVVVVVVVVVVAM